MKTVALLPLVLVAGCSMIPGTQANRFAKAQEAVRGLLVDPDSAQFRRVYVSEHDGNICGEVNAKNSAGGFAGFRPFSVTKTDGVKVMMFERFPNDEKQDVAALMTVISVGENCPDFDKHTA